MLKSRGRKPNTSAALTVWETIDYLNVSCSEPQRLFWKKSCSNGDDHKPDGHSETEMKNLTGRQPSLLISSQNFIVELLTYNALVVVASCFVSCAVFFLISINWEVHQDQNKTSLKVINKDR